MCSPIITHPADPQPPITPASCSLTATTWDSLRAPVIISLSLALLLLIVHEIASRAPATRGLYNGTNKKRLHRFRDARVPNPQVSKVPLSWAFLNLGADGTAATDNPLRAIFQVHGVSQHFRRVFGLLDRPTARLLRVDPPTSVSSTRSAYAVFPRQYMRPLTPTQMALLQAIGLDSYMFLRYLRLGFNISFYSSLMSFIVLYPVYATADSSETVTNFERFTIAVLPNNSPRLWAPFAFSVVFYCYVLRLLWIEWETFVSLRLDYLAHGDKFAQDPTSRATAQAFRYTVMIEGIKPDFHEPEVLGVLFSNLFKADVAAVGIVHDTRDVDMLIAKRKAVLMKYEDHVAARVGRGKEPSAIKLRGYKEAISDLTALIDDSIQRTVESRITTDTAFLRFKSISSRQIAIANQLFNSPSLLVYPAPGADDLIWENMSQTKSKEIVARVGFAIIWTFGVLVVISFNVFVGAFSNADKLQCDDWLSWVPSPEPGTLGYSLFTGLIPPVLWLSFMSLVFGMLGLTARRVIRFKSETQAETYVFSWFFLYQLVGFISIVLSGGVVDVFTRAFSNVGEFVEELSLALANSSFYFMSFTIIRWAKCFFDLSMTIPLLKLLLNRLLSPTRTTSQRRIETSNMPEMLNLSRMLPMFTFFVLISLTFSSIVPFANLLVAITFFIACKVYKTLTVYSTGKRYESGAMLIFQAHKFLIICLYVTGVLWILFLVVKVAFVQSGLFLIVMIGVHATAVRIDKVFVLPSKTMTLGGAAEADRENEEIWGGEGERKRIDWCYVPVALRRNLENEPWPYRREADEVQDAGVYYEHDLSTGQKCEGNLDEIEMETVNL